VARLRIVRLISSVCIALLAVAFVFTTDMQAVAPGYAIQVENQYLALYFNQNSASVAVRVKASGSVWYTNPPDWLDDPIVGGINREFIQSQIRISYFNDSAQELNMNSFFDSKPGPV